MTRKEFADKVIEMKKGTACTLVLRKSFDDKMYKKEGGSRKKDAPTNPFLGRVEIEESWAGYCVGVDYSSCVANAAVRSGNTEATKSEVRESLKQVWHMPYIDKKYSEFFSTDRATRNKMYINLNYNARQVANKVDSVLYLDGHVADAEELTEIIKWTKPNKDDNMSSTQVEHGVNEENRQFFICVNVENIISIKQGDKTIKGLWEPTTLQV